MQPQEEDKDMYSQNLNKRLLSICFFTKIYRYFFLIIVQKVVHPLLSAAPLSLDKSYPQA